VYGEWQKAYDELRNSVVPSISFVHNFNNQLYDTFNANTRNMLILDDQMENDVATARRGQGVVKFFTQGSHHRNLTVVYMVQNLFNQDPAMRTVSLNAHYMVLFKNPRDATQIRTLSIQMYPKCKNFLLDAMVDATHNVPYGYLLLNLRPDGCDALRVVSNVLAAHPTVYIPTCFLEKVKPIKTEIINCDEDEDDDDDEPQNKRAKKTPVNNLC